jgi:hypothetical protein
VHTDEEWPTDKLTALRLGRRLVAEVPASRSGRRAFVDIRPNHSPQDRAARADGWIRQDASRSFVVQHWEYAEDRLDGFDYDVGAEQIAVIQVASEEDLGTAMSRFGLTANAFKYPWDTDDPR